MKLNIKFKSVYFLWIVLSVITAGQAQQNPEYTQYMYNTMVINPGYTGSVGTLEASLLHRSQWVNMDGAPTTQSFLVHSPLANDKIGLGLSIVNDKLGPSSEMIFEGNFSYTIPFARDKRLSFGLKAGVRKFDVDWTKGQYYDDVDVLLNNNIDNEIKPTVGAGLYFYTDKWYVGASVPNFIKMNYYETLSYTCLAL